MRDPAGHRVPRFFKHRGARAAARVRAEREPPIRDARVGTQRANESRSVYARGDARRDVDVVFARSGVSQDRVHFSRHIHVGFVDARALDGAVGKGVRERLHHRSRSAAVSSQRNFAPLAIRRVRGRRGAVTVSGGARCQGVARARGRSVVARTIRRRAPKRVVIVVVVFRPRLVRVSFVILVVLVVPDGLDVHEHDARTQLRGLIHGEVPLDARCARGVVHRDDPTPLLHHQRRARVDAQSPRLHLRVERVQVEVDDHAPVRGGDLGGRLMHARVLVVIVARGYSQSATPPPSSSAPRIRRRRLRR